MRGVYSTKDFEYYLSDDGSMDTVITVHNNVTHEERDYRYSPEFSSEWRDEYGFLDFMNFIHDVVSEDVANDEWQNL